MTAVAVCIPTFRRTESLGRLLESLTRLHIDEARVTVVVVDNDAAGSAQETVAEFRDRLTGLVYAIEEERGIAAARNRLVQLALSLDPDFVAFVDDDEWVDERWLTHLLTTARTFRADVVIGPVLPSYEAGTPDWVREGKFFERRRLVTGAGIRYPVTGNSLITSLLFRRDEDNFLRCFPEGVGEDTHFFETAVRSGARIVWCDEAVVHEHVPSARANVGWLLRRGFNGGATFSRCLLLLGLTPRARLVRVVSCGARIVQGLALAPPSLVAGRGATIKELQRVATGLGGLVGLLGTSRARATAT